MTPSSPVPHQMPGPTPGAASAGPGATRRRRAGAWPRAGAVGASFSAALVGLLLVRGGDAEADAGAATGGVRTPGGGDGTGGSGAAGGGTTGHDGAVATAFYGFAGTPMVVGDGGLDLIGFVPRAAGAGGGGDRGEPGAVAGGSGPGAAGGEPDFAASITMNANYAAMAGGEAAAVGEEGTDGVDEGVPPVGETITGGDGDDTIIGTDRGDTIDGGGGDDTIFGRGGDDRLYGNTGDDVLYGEAGRDTLDGGPGDDKLDGGAGDDDLQGGDGDDGLQGGDGDDGLDGGAGDDGLDGGDGDDWMIGGPGDDGFVADSHRDLAFGGDFGDDTGGVDTLTIAPAFAVTFTDDPAFMATADDVTFMYADRFGQGLPAGVNDFTQLIDRSIENIVLRGDADYDVVAGDGANAVWGNAGDNRLYGFGGEDRLSGGKGDDVLQGGLGDDVLSGDGGRDVLYGGGGGDRYVVGLNESPADFIYDNEGANTLVLKNLGDRAVRGEIADGDLHLYAGDKEVAVWSGYVGHENALAGIDLGAGVVDAASLIRDGTAAGGSSAADGDLLAAFLPRTPAAEAGGEDWLESFTREETGGRGGTARPPADESPAADAAGDLRTDAPAFHLVGFGDETWLFAADRGEGHGAVLRVGDHGAEAADEPSL